MKRTLIRTLVILAAVSFVACLKSAESSFFRNFSLRQLVKENKNCSGLDGGTEGGGGGGISAGAGGLGGGSREFHSSKGDACLCKLKPAAEGAVDETALMASLASDVEKAITSSGPKIVERGTPDSSGFYFVYNFDNAKGRVTISGKNLQADQYSLQANLEESGVVK